ncbi:MAG: hypothetical protein ABIR61_13985 [Casimicrobiaceae bacterium]
MQKSDLNGIIRSGAIAHDRGVGYFDNPHYFNPHRGDIATWTRNCEAWSAGWLKQDNGADREIARLMTV